MSFGPGAAELPATPDETDPIGSLIAAGAARMIDW